VLCDLKTGEGRFAHAELFAGRKESELGDVAVGTETAQLRFQFVDEIEGGLGGLSCIGLFLVSDAHLEVRCHGAVVELVDFRHGGHFGTGSHKRMSTPGRTPKKSAR